VNLRRAALVAPVFGLACGAGLIWGIAARLDYWAASTFVLLLYGCLGCAVLAHVTARLSRRRGHPPLPWIAGELRRLLSALALVAALWCWARPLMQPTIVWTLRQATLWYLR
jgi:hypothetical protein